MTFSEYSDDEDHSDISLDELTDEEPEDLRATLNKNKKVVSIQKYIILKVFRVNDVNKKLRQKMTSGEAQYGQKFFRLYMKKKIKFLFKQIWGKTLVIHFINHAETPVLHFVTQFLYFSEFFLTD